MPMVQEAAPAKINLTLKVEGRRDDGYHLLESLVVFTAVGDRVTLETRQTGEGLSFKVLGPFAGALALEDGENNLVVQGLRQMAGIFGQALDLSVILEKNLPVASGIGGGSADAAAALRALSRLWNVRLSPSQIESFALSLGADVPVCYYSEACWMRGIGEALEPVGALPDLALLLINPAVPVATASIFQTLGLERGQYRPGHAALPPRRMNFDHRDALMQTLLGRGNDLQTAALVQEPLIASVLAFLESAEGCCYSAVSGSGATCFGLFEDVQRAKAASDQVPFHLPRCWRKPTVLFSTRG